MKSELLMPAGSLQRLKTAILYGADAVYLGTPDMSLRAHSKMPLEDVIEGVKYAHSKGKKVYLTLNLFATNSDVKKLPIFVETIRKVKPDGVIIADPAIFQYVKDNAPELELHVSTQANINSWMGVKFWENQGAALCVMARETPFKDIKEVKEKVPNMKIECFVHGAMCMSYSGRCLLSNFLASRPANKGMCAHTCRWEYKLHMKLKDGSIKPIDITEENKDLFEFLMEEEKRPGDFIPIEESEKGAYIMFSKDLCLMPVLNQYLEAGIDSLKIEGRNKSEYYAGIVARTYRKAIDAWKENPENWDYTKYMDELYTLQTRGYTLGFHNGRVYDSAQQYETSRSLGNYQYAMYIVKWDGDDAIVKVKNAIRAGDEVEFLAPDGDNIVIKMSSFVDSETGVASMKADPCVDKFLRINKSEFGNIENISEKLPELTIARKQTNYIAESDLPYIASNKESFESEINREK
ncbi:MAG: U32 family peptidase C-terminal domain-containing protein [Alphaproteobacteria bacterium]|jgi:putative protease|nr:U32 family peptidase C-terminal domain-containing protein [Alphaproteobacteria bacterium]